MTHDVIGVDLETNKPIFFDLKGNVIRDWGDDHPFDVREIHSGEG